MGCLTASERVQFPLLSRSNPGRYVKDVEVDTDTDETPACTPPARPRAEEEPRAVRVPRKRKWDEEADQSQRGAPTAPARSQATHEPSSRLKQKARKLVLPASSADTGRAVERRNSPSSGEDASARVPGRTAELSAPKARTPSEEARRPLGQGKHQAAPTNVPATDRCLASKQVPFDDSTSGQEPSAQEKYREEPSAQGPSAQSTLGQTPSVEVQTQLEESAEDEGRKKETRVLSAQTPSAQAPSAVADWAVEAGPPEARSPTPLEMLAGSGAAEVESVQGQPTGVLCEQVVPLLWYLDRKAAKYADPRHRGSYVELVKNRMRIKVAMNPELISLDHKYRELKEKNIVL
ncbi:hypothetical protein AXG93_4413s1210 [Marchantia polymorpha subsp. ruderalis]|uniref:Uncharacterized protein n=1 Tax=Marchantia polymorpha subsp. ruderalis TaxID=1480154 RepID=A0A176W1K2_MARPO|nr:hypothetical protein AXG93_4413s1210 [Marchantia polymorpha subsp. ruderalis]